jgi:hypothetical protein
MKTKQILVISAITILFLISCNPCRYVSKHQECFQADSILITNTVIQTDSIRFTEPDTMALSLLFECDSNNNVLMRELKDVSSKGIQTEVIFKDNRLDVSGFVDSIAILNKLIETTKAKETTKINPLNPELQNKCDKLENKLDRRNKIILWLSIACALLIIVFLLIFKFK